MLLKAQILVYVVLSGGGNQRTRKTDLPLNKLIAAISLPQVKLHIYFHNELPADHQDIQAGKYGWMDARTDGAVDHSHTRSISSSEQKWLF